MDWAKAKFVDRVLHSVWLDPDEVRERYDLRKIASAQRPVSARLLSDWQQVAPGSDAAVIAFDFRVTGNAKRKLVRRLNSEGRLLRRRGGLTCRFSLSLKLLDDYALAYAVIARECGGELLHWRVVPSPLAD